MLERENRLDRTFQEDMSQSAGRDPLPSSLRASSSRPPTIDIIFACVILAVDITALRPAGEVKRFLRPHGVITRQVIQDMKMAFSYIV